MDIFDLADLQICPWALREGVILERLDQLSDKGHASEPGRPLDGVGLPRVQRPRLRLRRVARLRRRRGDGRHRRAQPADAAVKQLSDHHELPVCAIHSPCLLFTQRVWGTDPWGKLERSAEMAHAVGADVVVVHPPFRWQKEYAAGFVDGIAALEESTGLAFAVENMYPWRASARRGVEMYLPGWDPSEENYANATIDLSHAAIAQSLAGRDGAAARRAAAPRPPDRRLRVAKDEHLVPGRGAMDAAGFLEHLADESASTATSSWRSTPARPRTREEREADLRESLEFAREHFPVRRQGSTPGLDARARRQGSTPGPDADPRRSLRACRRPLAHSARTPSGGARHPSRDPRCRAHGVRREGIRGTTIRAVAAAAGVDAALVHHYFGTKDDLFVAAMELPIDPRQVIAPALVGGAGRRGRAAAPGVPRRSGTTPRPRRRWSGSCRSALEPGGERLLTRASCRWSCCPAGQALGLDRPEVRMPLLASQAVGLILPLRARGRADRLDGRRRRGRGVRAGDPALPHRRRPVTFDVPRRSRGHNSSHDE